MDILCATYMIDKVKRYDIKGKKLFEQQDKFYFEDLGFFKLTLHQIILHIILNAVFQRSEFFVIPSVSQFIHICFGEVLIFVSDIFWNVDKLDIDVFPIALKVLAAKS